VGEEALRVEMTLAGYMEFKRAHPDTPLLCLEQPTPDAVLSLFDLGDYAQIEEEHGDGLYSRFFVGNAGNRSNLHYDCDYHAALLYQLFGHKQVVLISVSSMSRKARGWRILLSAPPPAAHPLRLPLAACRLPLAGHCRPFDSRR
jgi:hypothetical protein